MLLEMNSSTDNLRDAFKNSCLKEMRQELPCYGLPACCPREVEEAAGSEALGLAQPALLVLHLNLACSWRQKS